MRFRILSLLLLLCASAQATDYYVDFSGGNDANAGTSTGAPWKTIPGTRNTADSAFFQTAWGSITTGNKIQPGDKIHLKSGTSFSSSLGSGYVWINNSYYNLDTDTNGWDRLYIYADPAWGSGGPVKLDFAGVPNTIAGVVVQANGVTFDGSTAGLWMVGSSNAAVQYKEFSDTGNTLYYARVANCTVSNNYTFFTAANFGSSGAADGAAAGGAQLQFRRISSCIVSNCVVDGSGSSQFSNGAVWSNGSYANTNVVVRDSTFRSHMGDPTINDAGIGTKYQQCVTMLLSNNVYWGNLKGIDSGIKIDNANCTSYIVGNTISSNIWGANMTGRGVVGNLTSTHTLYSWNNLIFSNDVAGMLCYSTPYNLYIVQNLFAWNGSTNNTDSQYTKGQIVIGQANATDSNTPAVKIIMNNVMYRPASQNGAMMVQKEWKRSNSVDTWLSDYNTYVRNGSELWVYWSPLAGPDNYNFDWVTDKPGDVTGNWYLFYGNNTTPNTLGGTGHFHSDSHSYFVTNGASEQASGVFFASAYPTWLVSSNRLGSNISTQSWYQPFLGYDRNGYVRANYTIGPYEIGGAPPPPPNTPPTITQISDQATPINTATAALAFTVGDAESDPSTLTVSGSSSDQGILPNANIVFGGSGANRTVTLTPSSNRVGAVTVNYQVSDGTYTVARSFILTITGAEPPPAGPKKGRVLPSEAIAPREG